MWPGAAEVITAHDRVLAATGGAPGVRDRGLLESALNRPLGRPLATFDGRPLYAGPAERVAALIEALSRNHPFVDGNKRTAMLVGMAVLAAHGHPLATSPEAVEALAVAVAEGHAGMPELVALIQQA